MKIVMSLWTKPGLTKTSKGFWGWKNKEDHWYSWILAVNQARRFYSEVELVTDDYGKHVLIDQLDLPFTSFRLDLNNLDDLPTSVWAAGKIVAQRLQDSPYLHLDSDAYMWKPLPDRVHEAPVAIQCYESMDHYKKAHPIFRSSIAKGPEILLEPLHPENLAGNCGIVGGNDLPFLRVYTQTILDLLFDPENQAAFRTVATTIDFNTCYEQYYLTLLAKRRGVRIEPLMSALTPPAREAAEVGFTHLFGRAKYNDKCISDLRERVKSEYPEYASKVERTFIPMRSVW
jgi:hypothetical protein